MHPIVNKSVTFPKSAEWNYRVRIWNPAVKEHCLTTVKPMCMLATVKRAVTEIIEGKI